MSPKTLWIPPIVYLKLLLDTDCNWYSYLTKSSVRLLFQLMLSWNQWSHVLFKCVACCSWICMFWFELFLQWEKLTLCLCRWKIFSNEKYFTCKYFTVKHLQVFGKCWDLNIANINRPPPATPYLASTNHCKNIPTVIPFRQPPSSTQTPKSHQNHRQLPNHHQPFKTEPSRPPPKLQKTATNYQNKQPSTTKSSTTTQKTTINNPINPYQKS